MTNRSENTPLNTPGLGEFGRIRRFFAPLATAPGALGLTDDAAILDLEPNQQFVVTADALVEGVHFLPGDPADLVARKALRMNLSDLAAKASVPTGYLLSLALPRSRDDAWVEVFARGLAIDQAAYHVTLLGGDSVSTEGPAVVAITAWGTVQKGKAVLRRGAEPGDLVFVSGTLGDGALGLLAATGRLEGLSFEEMVWLSDRYRLPQPRLGLGVALAPFAHAMMDISDGLVADLAHLTEVSGVAARIEAASLPLSEAAASAMALDPTLLLTVLGGGDDYELLFTAAVGDRMTVEALGRDHGVAVTAIGTIGTFGPDGCAVTVVDADGFPLDVPHPGWRHS